MLHQDASYLPGRNTPYILTIHDLNFLFEKTPLKARKRLKRVQRLVDGAKSHRGDSKFTESVVREHLDLGDIPVQVVYNGIPEPVDVPESPPDFAPDGPFLFNVAMVRRKKNQHVLIDLLAKLDDLNLVIAGNTGDDYADEDGIVRRNWGSATASSCLVRSPKPTNPGFLPTATPLYSIAFTRDSDCPLPRPCFTASHVRIDTLELARSGRGGTCSIGKTSMPTRWPPSFAMACPRGHRTPSAPIACADVRGVHLGKYG